MAVEFNEEEKFNRTYRSNISSEKSGLANWLIKIGIAKDEKESDTVMIVIAVICFGLAIYFLTQ